MKRIDIRCEDCEMCGFPTSRKINFNRNQKPQYDYYVCYQCRPEIVGGRNGGN